MMEYHFIKTHQEDHIFRLTLARPEKRNAFTPTMVNEIHHALQEADQEEKVYLIEIDAEGPVFCSGMDIKIFADPRLDQLNPHIENNPDLSLGTVFNEVNKPILGLVEGPVYAGGFLIVLGCTYVLAKKDVQFALPETKIGLFPFQVMAGLLNHLPESQVLKLCIDTDPFGWEKAYALGLVDGLYSEEQVVNYRTKILRGSPFAIRRGIQALKQVKSTPESQRFDYLKKVLEEVRNSRDAQIGIQAWKEKKTPQWENR